MKMPTSEKGTSAIRFIAVERHMDMAKNHTWLGCSLVCIAAIVLVSWATWTLFYKGWTPGKVNRAIDSSLPMGSARAKVETWLDCQDIQHGPHRDENGKAIGQIDARIEHANVAPIFPGEINITFSFDENDQLVFYEIEPFVFCP